MLKYTLARLGLFVVFLGLFWLIPPLRQDLLFLVVAAALVSMIVSFFLLKKMREDYSARLSDRIERRHAERAALRAEESGGLLRGDDEADEDAETTGR